jgi:hypothetical protein
MSRGDKPVSDTPERSPDQQDHASPHAQGSAAEESHLHLAHWPPPQREHKAKPVIKGHEPNQPAQHAKWHLTRGIASKFADDDRD